jgi:GH24 family phage-related lysozyme (muramidase)
MTLAPTLNQGIGFEQPVQEPNILSGIGNTLSAFASGTSSRKGPSYKDQQEVALKGGLVEGLEKAQALREQGKGSQATRLERETLLKYSMQGGDLNSGDTQSLITTYTGRPSEDVGFTQEEAAFQDMIQSPEFQKSFLGTFASHPEASEEERINLAASNLQMAAATEDIIQQTKTNWIANQGQSSRIAKIEQWRQNNMGILSLSGTQNGRVDNNSVQQAMLNFGNLRAEIINSRPAGVDSGEWKPVEDSLAAVEKQLQLANELTSNDEIASDLLREVIDAVAGLEDVSAADKNVAIQILKKDPSAFLERGIIQEGTLQNIFSAASKVVVEDNAAALEKGNGNGDVIGDENPGAFTKAEIESVSGTDPSLKFRWASDLASAAGGITNVLNDQTATSQWIGLTRQGLASLKSMAAENEAWATAEGYRKYFNQNFFQTMDGLRNSGSTFTYDAMRGKALDAIDTNITALRAGINVRTESNIVEYSAASNSLIFNRDAFLASDRVPPSVKAEALSVIDNKYNGDIMKYITNEPSYLTSRIFGELQNSDVTDRIKAIDQLNTFKSRLPATEEELQGGEGVGQLGGGQGSDFMGPDTATGLIAEFEGFREGAYWDVNAFRAGFGSDTITLADGTVKSINETSVVTREDAERDLARRAEEFATVAKRQVGSDVWTNLPGNVTNALTSIAYNYGSLPDRIVPAVKSGDVEEIARAVETLKNDNDGVNSRRRQREADIIRGKQLPPSAAPIYASAPPSRPESLGQVEKPEVKVASASGTTVEARGASPEDATQVQRTEGTKQEKTPDKASEQIWGKLESQTKKMLVRLFGDEEAALKAIAEGEISEEDLL